MKQTILKIGTYLVLISGAIDLINQYITGNPSLLTVLGIPTKWVELLQFLGVIVAALSNALVPKTNNLVGGTQVPVNKDEK